MCGSLSCKRIRRCSWAARIPSSAMASAAWKCPACSRTSALVRMTSASFGPCTPKPSIIIRASCSCTPGRKTLGRPSVGSWVTYALGSPSQNLPGYVVLTAGRVPSGGNTMFGSGFLPSTFAGVHFRRTGRTGSGPDQSRRASPPRCAIMAWMPCRPEQHAAKSRGRSRRSPAASPPMNWLPACNSPRPNSATSQAKQPKPSRLMAWIATQAV